MKREDVIRMAREAGLYSGEPRTPSTGRMIEKRLERFAALVSAAERNRPWTQEHWTEYEHSIAAAAVASEREACAKVCEEIEDQHGWSPTCARAIRARGQA